MADLTTDLAAWRQARGRVGVQELPEAMPPGCPFVLLVDFSALSERVASGDAPNPLLDVALEDLKSAKARYDAYDAIPEDQRSVQQLLTLGSDLEASLAKYHDSWLRSFVVGARQVPGPDGAPRPDLRYYQLTDLPRGHCPEDGISVWDIPTERRRALVDLAQGGYAALEPFRAATREQDAVGDGEDAAPEAVELDAPPESVGGVPPGPSPLRAVGTGGSGPPGGSGRGAAGTAPPPARRATRRAG